MNLSTVQPCQRQVILLVSVAWNLSGECARPSRRSRSRPSSETNATSMARLYERVPVVIDPPAADPDGFQQPEEDPFTGGG